MTGTGVNRSAEPKRGSFGSTSVTRIGVISEYIHEQHNVFNPNSKLREEAGSSYALQTNYPYPIQLHETAISSSESYTSDSFTRFCSYKSTCEWYYHLYRLGLVLIHLPARILQDMGHPLGQSLPRRNVHVSSAILRMVETGKHRAKEGERWWVRISNVVTRHVADEHGSRDEAT